MLFEDDITVTFTMNAFNRGGRFIHIMGTKGELRAALDGNSPISLYYFKDDREETVDASGSNEITSGHGGGDEGIVNTVYNYFTTDQRNKNVPDIMESYYNHSIVFAAEKSRLENVVVDFEEYFDEINK